MQPFPTRAGQASLLFLTLLLAISACSPALPAPTTAMPTGPLRILAVESFLADIAQNVAGDRAHVDSLIPLGMDPHAFEPAPQDVQRINESNVLVLNGAGFEEWAARTLQNAGGERLVIESSAGLSSRVAREGESAQLSPAAIAESACLSLGQLNPQQELTASADAVSAPLFQPEAGATLTGVRLPALDGAHGGSLKLRIAEDNLYLLGAMPGTIRVSDGSGAEIRPAAQVTMQCGGLDAGILLDLPPGDYTVTLGGFAAGLTPLYVGAAGEHHHTGDPHFWLDPTLVIRYVENIRDGLSKADPAGAETYRRNAQSYTQELTALDGWIKEQVAQIPPEKRQIITNHESFGYFADRYGFKIIGTVLPGTSSLASPSAQQVAGLIDRIRAEKVSAIFLEAGSSAQLAEQISGETGIRVVTSLYTHTVTGREGPAPTYIEMMRQDVQAIVEALR